MKKGPLLLVPVLIATFLAGLGLLSLNGVVAMQGLQTLGELRQKVEHSHKVLAELEGVLAAASDAETGQRGYLLTGLDRYLEPYDRALDILSERLGLLRALTQDNPAQRQRLDAIQPLISEKLAELTGGIALRKEQGFDAALNRVLTDRGQQLMDQIRAVIAGMLEEERRLLQSREAAAQAQTDSVFTAMGVAFLVSAAGLGGVLHLVRRGIRQRLHTERILEESEERYRVIVENSLDAIITIDDQGLLTGWNAQAERIFDWSAKEVLGRPLAQTIIPHQHRHAHEQGLKHYLATGEGPVLNKRIEVTALHRTGREFPIELAITPIRLQGRLSFSAFVRDITERKRAEAELRESEARFRTMADSTPALVWMSGADKLRTYFNRPWTEFTGNKLDQELGDGWTAGVHPDDLERCMATYAQAFDALRPFQMEYRLRHVSGEYRWLLDSGLPRFTPDGEFLGYIGSCIDVTERKQAADLVEKQHAFLRQVIDTDPNFLFAKDRDGRFTLANQAVADAYGTSVEKLIGRMDADFNPNREEVEFFRRVDQEVMDTLQERFIAEETITDVTGRRRWLQTVKRPLVGDDGTASQVLGSATDITERKRAEERFRLVIENAPNGMIMVDEVGTIHLVNAELERQFGYCRHELLGQSIELLVPPRFRAQHPGQRAHFFAAPKVRAMGAGRDLFALRKDGTEFPVEIGLTPLETPEGRRVLASIVDITERRRREDRRQQLLAAIVESTEDAIFSEDLEGRITSWNRGAERLFGYTAEEAVGATASLLIPHDRVEESREIIERVKQGERIENYETLRRAKDGTVIDIALTISPIKDTDGRVIGASRIARDISERKRTEVALKETNAELNAFAYTVSHDLRAPLRAMQGFAQALLEDYLEKLDTTGQEYARRIVAAAQRMDTLIQDLLAYSRLSRADIQLSRVNLWTVLADVRGQLDATVREKQATITVCEPLPPVIGHAQTLGHVLANLLANAMKFVRAGAFPQVRIWAEDRERWVRLWVEDNGIGIASEHHERIFHVFERLHGAEAYPGTGVGLAIVRKGMERMGGRAGVESEPGNGSRFWVELERARENDGAGEVYDPAGRRQC